MGITMRLRMTDFYNSECVYIAEPVMGAADSDENDRDDQCNQMVMAWTLDKWRVIKHFL